MPTNPIQKILIVGLGSIGTRHLGIAREQFPSAEIKILRHQFTESTPPYSNGCISTIEEALQFAPQLAIIANPSVYHVPIAQALAEKGIHLLIEKPLSSSLVGVSKLIETCRQQKTVLIIGYNLRYLPSLIHFRNLLQDGFIGEVLSIRSEVGQFLPSWRPNTDYRQSVSAKKELGGGVLLELSHEIDYLQWIFGDIKWVIGTLSKQSSLDIDVEDSAHIILGFQTKSDKKQLIGTLNMDFIRHDQTRICTAIGSKGSLRWDGISGAVSMLQRGTTYWEKLFSHESHVDETYVAEWIEFIDLINKGKYSADSGLSGLRVVEVIESVRLSAETGTQVSVSEVQHEKFPRL